MIYSGLLTLPYIEKYYDIIWNTTVAKYNSSLSSLEIWYLDGILIQPRDITITMEDIVYYKKLINYTCEKIMHY